MRALNTAATGMLAQQLNVDVISNNIANLNTTGYKRQRAEFQDLLYQNIERVGTNTSEQGNVTPTGIQVGVGVRTAGIYRITDQGSLINTENTYDLAVNGRGFFRILQPDGEFAYTRAGAFNVDNLGQIVTSEGFVVQPATIIPQEATSVTVNPTGQVQIILDGQIQPQVLGQFELALFPNENGLESIGNNMFIETQSSGAPNLGVPGQPGFGTIIQGFLEGSNVDAVKEITTLITAQRAYDLNSKVIQTADEMLSSANQLR